MKKIFVALLLLTGFYGFGQSVGKLRYDTVVIEKVGGTAELVIRNSTKDTLGFLYNFGNGRTGFKTIPASSGSSGLTGARNLGTSHRIFLPDSSGWKTLANGYAIGIDSATANTLTFKADTSLLSTKLNVTALLQGKYGPSDTTSTIQPRLSVSGFIAKNNNTLSLVNDTTACDTCFVGYVAGRRGTYPSVTVDLSAATPGQYLQFQGNRSVKPVTLTTGLTIGTTAITSGTAQRVLYESSTNKLSETAGFTFDGTNILAIPASGQYQINTTPIAYLPDQTSFANTIYFGVKPASLSHSSGVEGQFNTFAGIGAGTNCISCSVNTAFGSRAGTAITLGVRNSFGGESAGAGTTQGNDNTTWGNNTLSSNTTSSFNTAVGSTAMKTSTSANGTGVGFAALFSQTTGADNTALGFQAGYFNQTKSRNTNIGSGAGTGPSANSNANNTALGYFANHGITTGDGNIAIGDSANYNITTTIRSITIGTACTDNGNNSLNLGALLFGTGMTGTGVTPAGNLGVAIATPREVLDVNGQVSIRTVNAAAVTSGDSVLTMEDGRAKAINMAPGEYTPTLGSTTSTNVASSSSGIVQYTRDGDRITVTGSVGVTATTTSVFTSISVTLPFPSAMTLSTDLSGVASCQTSTAVAAGFVSADTGNDVALVNFYPVGTSTTVYFCFTYKVK